MKQVKQNRSRIAATTRSKTLATHDALRRTTQVDNRQDAGLTGSQAMKFTPLKSSKFATAPMCLAMIGLLSLGIATGVADDRNRSASDEQAASLQTMVTEALSFEIYGDQASRNSLLERVIEIDPDHALARWQLGFVKHQGEWVQIEQLAQSYDADPNIRRYLNRRNQAEDTLESQLELAAWCQERQLYDQEKAHLFRVLQFDPNHGYARTRLGFRSMGGEWIAAEDIAAAMESAEKNATALQRWGSDVEALRQRMYSGNARARELAVDEVLTLRDPEVIPAVEVILANDSIDAAFLAVEVFAQINALESATALARQAVFSAWPEIRQAAAEKLAERNRMDYVPILLAELQSPIMTFEQILPGRGRRLIHRKVYVSEDQDNRYAHVQDSSYRRVLPIGDTNRTWNRVLNNASNDSQLEDQTIQQVNLETGQLNERIFQTLQIATGVQLPAQPQAWWSWWNQDNDILLEGSKTLLTSYDQRESQVLDETPRFSGSQSSGATTQQTRPQRSYECLIEGTEIWTTSGPQAIETIQVGDLVLSKNVETGELTYQPVLRTTQRPASPTILIKLFDEEIQSSAGHPFWVSGEGWVKAKDLQSGMELHTMTGAVRISAVDGADEQVTYNLVVDGFASYFVGGNQVLSHDHTLPKATIRAVPGLTTE